MKNNINYNVKNLSKVTNKISTFDTIFAITYKNAKNEKNIDVSNLYGRHRAKRSSKFLIEQNLNKF